MKKRISIKQIAKLAEVSHTTVSLCLNKSKGYERISEKTRQKITKIAKEHKYTKNNYASSLRTNKSPIIGLLVPTLRNRFFARLSEEFQENAFKMNLFPIISVCNDSFEKEKQAINNFIIHNVSSIFITSSSHPNELMQHCSDNNIFSICLDNISQTGISITSKNKTSSYKLTKIFLEKNNYDKDILFIGGQKKSYTTNERIKGFKECLKDNNLIYNDHLIIHCPYSVELSYKLVSKLIKQKKLETKSIYFNSLVVLEGGLKAIKKYEDINKYKIASFDYHEFLDITNFNIISAKQHPKTMVKEAFKYLKIYKNTKTINNKIIKIPTTIIHN